MANEGDGNVEDVSGKQNVIDLLRSPFSLSSLNSTPLSTARSFITIKDQKFVDENCNDYVVAG